MQQATDPFPALALSEYLPGDSVVWLAGFGAMCFALFATCGALGPLLCGRDWDTLDAGLRLRWRIKFVSVLHSVYAVYGSVRTMAYDPDTSGNPVGTTVLRSYFLGVTTVYIIYDTVLSVVYWKYMPDPSIVYHHVMAIASYGLGFWNHYCTYQQAMFQVIELTTPVVALRWYLQVTGRGASRLYFWNGLVMMVTFFFVRIVWTTYVLLGRVFPVAPLFHPEVPTSAISWFFAVAFVLVQWFWFAKIMSTAARFLGLTRGKKGGKGGSASKEDLYKET
jgi:hypothetical protein|eukprot:TRINITY_DN6264_c1_g1_i1.p3 TRINITY_DN6264_c1_g1~~TRINITY_DN6264_c1_g1_i1.p3  ORF type:complete len:294 (+),score=124.33 TRINITY_DN6264_c1_g1_i1:51-884(+)